MAINFGTFGIPQAFQNSTDVVNLNPDRLAAGIDQLGDMFDRWHREKAIGGLYSTGLMAARAKCQKLASKLRELQAELREAQAYEQQGMALPADEARGAAAARGMQGYVSPAGAMLGYRPGTEQERAYGNAYAMMGAQVPNARM